MNKKIVLGGCGAALLAAVCVVAVWRSGPPSSDRAPAPCVDVPSQKAIPSVEPTKVTPSGKDEAPSDTAGAAETPSAETPSGDAEAREEAKVDAFDAQVDRWMEPAKKGVTMADVDAFVAQFNAVPAHRKEECLQRALNLIPDDNVMLLAGVLMDKSQPKELVELVFNDILNRDEDVKHPILQQIFKDKTHPCWPDVAWILDVTGQTPAR